MARLDTLIAIMKETRAYLALEGNDFSWSSWSDAADALAEIDSILAALEAGTIPYTSVLFAPTGPIQEVSLSSGWGNQFLRLANAFDQEYENLNR